MHFRKMRDVMHPTGSEKCLKSCKVVTLDTCVAATPSLTLISMSTEIVYVRR